MNYRLPLTLTLVSTLFLAACDAPTEAQAEQHLKDQQDVEARAEQRLKDQVALNEVEQYTTAKSYGAGPIELCVHANFVVAAYLQAKDENHYRYWKMVQKSDCDRAGVS